MTQFSFKWILSLNCLCQNWGQVQLATLDLRTELVVLSGCETAVGPSIRGEGIISLARPLFQAGTRAVLATQWKVEDEASAEFMRAYYSSLLGGAGASPVSALHAARRRLWLTRRWHDPAFWSAYVFIGDAE